MCRVQNDFFPRRETKMLVLIFLVGKGKYNSVENIIRTKNAEKKIKTLRPINNYNQIIK